MLAHDVIQKGLEASRELVFGCGEEAKELKKGSSSVEKPGPQSSARGRSCSIFYFGKPSSGLLTSLVYFCARRRLDKREKGSRVMLSDLKREADYL